MNSVIYEEMLPPGAMWSMRIRRSRRIRLITQEADANISCLVFNAEDPLDRLNIPDTLKALHTAKLHTGHVLMSDMGRSLMSLTADSTGWHDPLGGVIDAQLVREKFGVKDYQEVHNEFFRNGRDNFLVELGKHGLGESDIVANINFFSKVLVDDDGKMRLVMPGAPANAFVELRADMHVLAVLANCPHPLHPAADKYPSSPVKLEISSGQPAEEDDACRHFRPECGRALALTERYLL